MDTPAFSAIPVRGIRSRTDRAFRPGSALFPGIAHPVQFPVNGLSQFIKDTIGFQDSRRKKDTQEGADVLPGKPTGTIRILTGIFSSLPVCPASPFSPWDLQARAVLCRNIIPRSLI